MKRKIVLASRSPRRKQLLEQIGLKDFEIRESKYEEDMTAYKDPYVLAQFLGLGKAKEVAKHYDDAIIIAADTFVVYKNKFLGKPKTEKKAREMLKELSGKSVKIITGYAIIDTKNDIEINSYGEGEVKIKKLTDEEIDDYISTGEPMERAGAFAIQEKGSVIIESTSGDYQAMVGLPVYQIYHILKGFGINTLL